MPIKVFTIKQVIAVLSLIIFTVCAFAIILDRLAFREKSRETVAAFATIDDELPEPTHVLTVDFTGISATDKPIETEALALQIEVVKSKANPTSAKKILIYHTHTYEAYEPTEQYPYTSSDRWRSKNSDVNVVRVGTELADLLTALGYEVTHDLGEYEPPKLDTSYTRSLKMLEDRTNAGETYDLYIDLHRDAFTSSMQNNNTVTIGDVKTAKLMMLIGKGTGQTAKGYTQKPEWEKNHAIAQALTDDLNAQCEGLCRRISLKSGRFNQHIAPRCVLIEVGNNKNTLEEALAAMPYLADAIDNVLEIVEQEAL